MTPSTKNDTKIFPHWGIDINDNERLKITMSKINQLYKRGLILIQNYKDT